ncbi:MAG TPA: alkaline phosphatase, partial [Actinomycetota bacterium]
APQDADGNYDPNGTVQWVVGTGGKNHAAVARPRHRLLNSQIADSRTFGVLQLILKPGRYNWRFIAVDGGTFRDGGVAHCT